MQGYERKRTGLDNGLGDDMRRFKYVGLFNFHYLGYPIPMKGKIYTEDEIFEYKPVLYWATHENEKISKEWKELKTKK